MTDTPNDNSSAGNIPDIFISYSSKDRSWVVNLANYLIDKGYVVWWDQELVSGQAFRKHIEDLLEKSKCIIVVWSGNSICSPWVEAEAKFAFEHEKLIPISIQDGIKIPIVFDTLHTPSLSNWKGKESKDIGLIQLNKAINNKVNTTSFISGQNNSKNKKKRVNKKAIFFTLIFLLTVALLFLSNKKISQDKDYEVIGIRNLDFEDKDTNFGWSLALDKERLGSDYFREIDKTISHSGNASGHLRSAVPNPEKFTTFSRYISDIEVFKGQRIRMSAYLKTKNVNTSAGLWLRIDGRYNNGENRMLGLDNMLNRPIKGTTEWKKYNVIMDVPETSTGIAFGMIFEGTGEAWVDDFKFELVDESLELTTIFSDPDEPSSSKDSGINNSGFEQGTYGWLVGGSKPKDYVLGIDRKEPFLGTASAFLKSIKPDALGHGSLMQNYHNISKYRGKRIRISTFVKNDNVNDYSVLWLNTGETSSYLRSMPLAINDSWKKLSVDFDIPNNIKNINFGVMLKGSGTIYVDDFKLEIIEKNRINSTFSLGKLTDKKDKNSKQILSNDNDFTDQGDGIIIDNKNNLMWMKCSIGQEGNNCLGKAKKMIFDEAVNFSKSFSFNGYQNWRLPTKNELKSIVYCSKKNKPIPLPDGIGCGPHDDESYQRPTISKKYFPNTPPSWFWTSEALQNDKERVWILYFNHGNAYALNKYSDFYFRLVRDKKIPINHNSQPRFKPNSQSPPVKNADQMKQQHPLMQADHPPG